MRRLAGMRKQFGASSPAPRRKTLADKLHGWETAPTGFALYRWLTSRGIGESELSAAEDYINRRQHERRAA